MIAICQWLLNADFPAQLRESKLSAYSLVTLRHLLNAAAVPERTPHTSQRALRASAHADSSLSDNSETEAVHMINA